MPHLVGPLFAATALGRSVNGSKSKLVSVPVTMLKGLPEETSMIGATVNPERMLGKKLAPERCREL